MIKIRNLNNKSRTTTYLILEDFLESHTNIDIIIDIYQNKINLNKSDKKFLYQLLYGILRSKRILDNIIKKHSNIKINKVKTKAYIILLIGSYQLVYMNSVPSYAAISTAVDIAKKHYPNSQTYINAVLRSMSKEKYEPSNFDFSQFNILSDFLLNKWRGFYSNSQILEMSKIFSTKPVIWARINNFKIDNEVLYSKLKNNNIEFKKDEFLNNFFAFYSLNAYIEDLLKRGYIYIQNPSSGYVVNSMEYSNINNILDACSSPGGKISYMAELIDGSVDLYVNEINSRRYKILVDNVERLGLTNVEFLNDDLLNINNIYFDLILLDVPCSSTGTIKKNPDINWSISESKIKALSQYQYELLVHASKLLKSDGKILYSTCSLEEEENELLIKKFLDNNKDFSIKKIEQNIPKKYINKYGNLKILPNSNSYEGMFASILQKNG